MFTENNLAINIASAYFNYYEKFYTGKVPSVNTNWTGGVATSVINSAALDNLAMVVKAIIPKYIQDARVVQCNDIQLYDFDNLIQNLTGGKDNADYQSWRQAFDEAVIYRKTTPKNYSGITYSMFSMEKAEGLSTYIPRGSFDSKINNFYRTLQWYSAAGWGETGW